MRCATTAPIAHHLSHTGPLASALTDRFGCRWVTIGNQARSGSGRLRNLVLCYVLCLVSFAASGLLSASGFVLGYFAYSLGASVEHTAQLTYARPLAEHLFIAFSIAGAGLALSYVTSIVIVAYYFERKRSLATGLAVCGTGFGTFVFAPLTIYLLEKYSWRGTMLIMAGFFLNIVVCGALMRDPPEQDEDGFSDRCDFESDNYANEALERMQPSHGNAAINTAQLSPSKRGHDGPPSQADSDCGGGGGLSAAKPRLFSSLVHIPTYITHRGSITDPQDIIHELTQRKDGYLSRLLQRYPQVLSSFLFGQRELPRSIGTNRRVESRAQVNGTLPTVAEKQTRGDSATRDNSSSNNNAKSPDSSTVRSPRTRPSIMIPPHRLNSLVADVGPGAHLRNLKLQRGSISISSYRSAMLSLRRYRLRSSSCPDIYRNELAISGEANAVSQCHVRYVEQRKAICILCEARHFRRGP